MKTAWTMKSALTPFAALFLAWWAALHAATVSPPAAERIPFPNALEAAAVAQDRLDDIDRRALVLGNGDLSGLLWDRNGVLCLRVTKNDVWDARVDTSPDPPMLQVDLPNQKWKGGTSSPPSYAKPYPQPRCAAVIRLEGGPAPLAIAAGLQSARLDLRRAVARAGDTTVRVLADRNVFLIETDKEVFLEEIKAPELPAAERGAGDGAQWLHAKLPGDLDDPGMEYTAIPQEAQKKWLEAG